MKEFVLYPLIALVLIPVVLGAVYAGWLLAMQVVEVAGVNQAYAELVALGVFLAIAMLAGRAWRNVSSRFRQEDRRVPR